MCTILDEHTALICPVAIDRVRDRLHEAFGDLVQCTTREDQGTLVQVPSTIDSVRFQAVTRAAIAAAQKTSPDPVGT
jgi:hypothetical protein